MDSDELREILSTWKVDVWSLIDSAVTVAAADYGDELKNRRDGIVQKLYFPTRSGDLCRSFRSSFEEKPPLPLPQQQKEVQEMTKSPFTPESNHRTDDDNEEEGDLDPFGGLFDDDLDKIRHIREQLEDPNQDDETLVELLQNLVDMDVTFEALQETYIGRVVSGFRKQHHSNEVRKLAKLLIRNWKETVDEWVRLNPPEQASASNHQTDDDNEEESGLDPFGGLFDDEPDKIRHIREQLEDPNQDEESLVELLQNLVDMDITFKALQETYIGRVVSGFRKQHPSNEVRKLAKLLIRNWKETVDEWVRFNPPEQASASLVGVGDSPQLNMQIKNHPNGHYQGSESSYSPNPQNWGSGSEKNYVESPPKAKAAPPRETPPTRPPQSAHAAKSSSTPPPNGSDSSYSTNPQNWGSGSEKNYVESVPKAKAAAPGESPPARPPQSAHAAKSSSAPPPNRQEESSIDIDEKLNSARRRLRERYQEAQNAKRQRSIQVLDLHDLPRSCILQLKGGGRDHRS